MQRCRDSCAFPFVEVVDEFLGGLVSLVRISLKALRDDLPHCDWNCAVETRNWNGAFVNAFQQTGQRRLCFERHRPGQQLKEDQTDGEQVGPLVDSPAHRLLGRHVLHGAEHSAGLGHSIGFERAGKSEVHDQDSPLRIAHDVARLQIAMNDAFAVGSFQTSQHLFNDLRRILYRELALFLEDLIEAGALHVLHGDKSNSIRLAKIENTNNIAVRDLPGQDQLLFEALQNFRITRQFWPDYLQSDHAVEFVVAGFVDRTHSAFAKHLQDLVTVRQNAASREQKGAAPVARRNFGDRTTCRPGRRFQYRRRFRRIR